MYPYTNTPFTRHMLSYEKWFYGLLARTFAKACESLGITKQTFSCQHKSHINKVILTFSLHLTHTICLT